MKGTLKAHPALPGAALAGAALVAMSLWTGCFEGTTGGSETTNGLSGRILDGEGRPAGIVEVTLVPEAHRAPEGGPEGLLRTRSDAQGNYRFRKLEPGAYNLEAGDSSRGLKLLHRGIRIGNRPDSQAVLDASLAPSGTLRIPFADRRLPQGAIAWIPGTTWQARVQVGEASMLDLPRLPAGPVPEVRVSAPDSAGGSYVLADSLTVEPGGITDVPALAAWGHRKTLRLNLQGLPADSLGGHPVLLRLHAGNFDFSEAGPGGEDLRIAGPDGVPLNHQIQHWDAAAREAALWVRLDSPSSVSGDTSLTLHWGRGDALDPSSGPATFDSTRGFSSVWPLRGSDSSGLQDATGRFPLSPLPGDSSVADPGPAGSGRRFSGTGGLTASMPRGFGGNASFTVSFWTRFEAAPRRQTLVRFGLATPLRGFHLLIRPDTTAQFGPFDSTPDATPSPAQNHFPVKAFLNRWVHVASVYNASTGTVTAYIDSKVMATNSLPALDVDAAAGVRLAVPLPGANETGLHGSLADVRFVARAVGAAWIKAEYETAREGGALLELR
jgi:hypothetical protein